MFLSSEKQPQAKSRRNPDPELISTQTDHANKQQQFTPFSGSLAFFNIEQSQLIVSPDKSRSIASRRDGFKTKVSSSLCSLFTK